MQDTSTETDALGIVCTFLRMTYLVKTICFLTLSFQIHRLAKSWRGEVLRDRSRVLQAVLRARTSPPNKQT